MDQDSEAVLLTGIYGSGTPSMAAEAVDNDRPIGEVAREILDWLGWT